MQPVIFSSQEILHINDATSCSSLFPPARINISYFLPDVQFSSSPIEKTSRQQINSNSNVSLIHCKTHNDAVCKPLLTNTCTNEKFVPSTEKSWTRRRKARKNFNPAFSSFLLLLVSVGEFCCHHHRIIVEPNLLTHIHVLMFLTTYVLVHFIVKSKNITTHYLITRHIIERLN